MRKGRPSVVKGPRGGAEASFVILLEEAVTRLNRAGRPYGVRLDPWARRTRARSLIEKIEAHIWPLQLPVELRAFWASWNPGTLREPVFDGFISLERMIERRSIDCPPCPEILLPIADWTNARIWFELATDDHPGGRVFHSHHDDSEVRLWAFGVSALLDLVSTALERDAINDRVGGLDARSFERIVAESLDATTPSDVPRVLDGVDRSRFPAHWQFAEGLSIDHFSLRGASHTVESLLTERQSKTQVGGTLVGTYQTDVGGGPLQGCIGTFEDRTGSLQVFVPQLTAMAGAVGDHGAVEIDVVAVAPNGDDLDSLSVRNELLQAARGGFFDYGNDMMQRLFEQMKYLDTSIVVTGMRPIR